MAVPKLPKLLEYAGRELPREIAALTREWASGVQDVLRALKSGQELHDSQIAALQADLAAGTGWNPADGVFHWNPDAEPASPGNDSLWFPGSSWTGFTEWDPGSMATWDVDTTKHMGQATLTGNGSLRWSGMYRAIPNSEFVVYTQANPLASYPTGGFGCGLFVAGDIAGSPTTADFRTLDTVRIAAEPITITTRSRDWDAYNGTASSIDTASNTPAPYMRMRVNGTTVHSDISENGVDWITLGTTGRTVGFTPAYFGVACVQVTNLLVSKALFRFIQTYSGTGSSAYDATAIGRGVSLPLYP